MILASKDVLVVEKKNKKILKWSDQMNENLVDSILNYKIKYDFNSIDFDADKSMQYSEVSKSITKLLEIDLSYFEEKYYPQIQFK